ncbi:hypothetical protein KAI92_01495 [Candidatus Parcubacteria bacterium]|nr:hypothetical protein [Candidatus Parcubacteria bacterium]
MIIELKLFLYIYYGFLIIWFSFFLTSVFHMLKFGFKNVTTILTTVIFILISILILSTSFYYINEVDWNQEVEILKGVFNNEINIEL